MSSNKKYGLIVPEKPKQPSLVFQASRNVFGDDLDSDDESNKKPVLLQPSHNINRQAKIAQNKAVVEDPTVFQYDEVYDAMKNEKEEKKVKDKEIKKPRYIENLLKSANKRKIENERRIERQIQKERESEGDQFADKEVFVTSAYKKKLEEMSLEEEKEKREEYLESIGDVTKQRDLGGFYRHLYEQKLGVQKPVETEEKHVLKEDFKKANKDIESGKKDKIKDGSKKRNYRKRKSSSDYKNHLSEGELEDSDEEINRINLDDIKMAKKAKLDNANLDADSDFSIDESSDEDEKVEKSESKGINEDVFKKPEPIEKIECKEKVDETPDTQPKAVTKKPKVNIWQKRTVGEVFEQALKRYYERKAARSLM
ncbi:nuclear speckle splicing regulatory protein 1 [Ostrinia furnacalis]|uniref:nuclear speckle splicing regulatory protein 1 n=1 Tax=Ostrinia furnacalis TaxID=93504 RepID=UPI00103A1593|nr:nuclear speckle splicing regulatory protein 1 [Ostrinia furnacalis]